MTSRINQLIYGSLLHDIGKVIQRANKERVVHAKLGGEYLKQFVQDKAILEQVRYHHAKQMKQASLADDSLAYITYIADNIASGADRRLSEYNQEESSYINFDASTNQEDIFNQLFRNEETDEIIKKYYKPQMLDDRQTINMPSNKFRPFNPGDYAAIVNKFNENLALLDFSDGDANSILALLESTLSYVPSSTNLDEAVDISLYDHSKLTSALASGVYYYLNSQEVSNYKDYLFKNAKNFYEEEAFLLVKFDVSGIQKFIYMIQQSGAAKMLRTRSFYLEMLVENLIDDILEDLELSRANLLYSGGGGAYLLLPNTEASQSVLAKKSQKINQFLMEEFRNDLYVAFASTAFAANEIMGNDARVATIYKRLGDKISAQKLQRYSADDIRSLNQAGKRVGRECSVCHRIAPLDEGTNRCQFCQGLIDFSKPFQKTPFFKVSNQVSPLPVTKDRYLHAVAENPSQADSLTDDRFYSKNKFYIGKQQAVNLWIGDYNNDAQRTFNDYAAEARGIKRLAVVRCDVDDLGQAFVSGFSDRFNTFSRTASFSRVMSMFFKYYINLIMEDLSVKGTIIYAGGDDVFVVGEWFDMIRFAIKLRQDFIEYSQGKLTLSTGIGIYPAKTPIAIMANETGDLESAAKSAFEDKDAIALFSKDSIYKWDDFIHNIWEGKLEEITAYFDAVNVEAEDVHHKAFIYQMLDLIEESFNESDRLGMKNRGEFKTISWARWIYYLARLEPRDKEAKVKFQSFTEKLHHYFQDEKEIKELKQALELYIYQVRGE